MRQHARHVVADQKSYQELPRFTHLLLACRGSPHFHRVLASANVPYNLTMQNEPQPPIQTPTQPVAQTQPPAEPPKRRFNWKNKKLWVILIILLIPIVI